MFNNFANVLNFYQQLRTNPIQVISSVYDVPQDIDTSDSSNIIQHLLNTNQITQEQLDKFSSMRNNPLIQKLMNTRF